MDQDLLHLALHQEGPPPMGQEGQAVQEDQVLQAIPEIQENHLHPDQEHRNIL